MNYYSLYIGLPVTTGASGGIEPFLRNVNYPSMVVFLNRFFFKYYHAKNHIICNFKNWSRILLIL